LNIKKKTTYLFSSLLMLRLKFKKIWKIKLSRSI